MRHTCVTDESTQSGGRQINLHVQSQHKRMQRSCACPYEKILLAVIDGCYCCEIYYSYIYIQAKNQEKIA